MTNEVVDVREVEAPGVDPEAGVDAARIDPDEAVAEIARTGSVATAERESDRDLDRTRGGDRVETAEMIVVRETSRRSVHDRGVVTASAPVAAQTMRNE
jgi:hypothetical protein